MAINQGGQMQRYFFDVLHQSRVFYDFAGRNFKQQSEVRDMAEMIALDVACTDGEAGAFGEVQVRDNSGRQLFSIPILDLALVAA